MNHAPAKMIRDVAMTHYVGKGYKSQFACPACGRKVWQHLGFLGRRDMVCDGARVSKVEREPTCECTHARGDHEGMGITRGKPVMSACGICDCNQWRPR